MKTFFNIREAFKKEVTEAPEDDMPASPDEASMALDQAKFIAYVAEEIADYIEGGNEFPEWMQNKLTGFHEKAKDMHAVMAGKYNETNESDANWAKSMEKQKFDRLSKKDQETLMKLRDLMAKEKGKKK